MLSNQPFNQQLEASLKFGTFEFNYGSGEMLWSAGMYKIFDCDVKYYSPVIEQHSFFFTAEDIEKLAIGIKYLEKFQRSFELITKIRTATNEEKHIKLFMIGEFVDGKICKRKGFTQDISFEIKEQEENAFFRERVNLALYATNTGTWDYHVINDKLYWDESMFVLFDLLSVTDIRGFSSWVDMIHPDDRDEFINHFNLGSKGLLENHTLNFTSRILTAFGKVEYIKINARFYFDDNMLNYRVIGTCVNTTKEQIIQSEIVNQATLAQENLIKAQDASNSRALFLANMSHEIRTPLNTVMGALQIMQSYDLDMDTQSLLEMAMQSSSDLLSLINNVLELSKIDANEMNIDKILINIHDLGQKAIDKFKLNLVKPIKLNIEVSPDFNPNRNTDPVKVNQILNNLLGNAIKFTQSGTVLLHITGDAENVEISVKDTGIGIPQTQIDHIFEIFKQADESTPRRFGGTGLGLAICKGIAEKMNGKIFVSSLEGKGSTFTFRAPMPIVSEE